MKMSHFGINSDESLLLLCEFDHGLDKWCRYNAFLVVRYDYRIKIGKCLLDIPEKFEQALSFKLSAVLPVEAHDLLIVGDNPRFDGCGTAVLYDAFGVYGAIGHQIPDDFSCPVLSDHPGYRYLPAECDYIIRNVSRAAQKK